MRELNKTMEEDIELIDLYIDDQLSEEQRVAFENRLKSDEAFKSTVQQYMAGVDALNEETDKEVRMEFHEYLQHTRVQKKQWNIYRYAAAVALIICGVFVFNVFQDNSNSPNVELEHYLAPFPGVSSQRGSNDTNEAIISYNKQEYEKALPGLLEAAETEASPSSFHLMVGNCYLYMNDYTTALTWFAKMTAASDRIDVEHGQWFTAITKFKSGETEEAIAEIEKLAAESQHYKEYAQQFLDAYNQ